MQQAYLIYRKLAEAPLIWTDTQDKTKWNLFSFTNGDPNQTKTQCLCLMHTASESQDSTRVEAHSKTGYPNGKGMLRGSPVTSVTRPHDVTYTGMKGKGGHHGNGNVELHGKHDTDTNFESRTNGLYTVIQSLFMHSFIQQSLVPLNRLIHIYILIHFSLFNSLVFFH
jgi:hypothetical protein